MPTEIKLKNLDLLILYESSSSFTCDFYKMQEAQQQVIIFLEFQESKLELEQHTYQVIL